ncbi:MAG: hypothetical protein GF313_16330 [Caldithrix sp.]|nr:hypothetical protein [Caldithrix sp.]
MGTPCLPLCSMVAIAIQTPGSWCPRTDGLMPMKRSVHLQPLSREHHILLVNANRLKRGIVRQTEPAVLDQFWRFIWQYDIQPHFEREEQILLTGVSALADSAPVQVLHNDHESLRQEAKNLLAHQPATWQMLKDFVLKLIAHIRHEERVLFPFIEGNCSDTVLTDIGNQLQSVYKPGCVTWNPEFWK